jgi:hypothetical protein
MQYKAQDLILRFCIDETLQRNLQSGTTCNPARAELILPTESLTLLPEELFQAMKRNSDDTKLKNCCRVCRVWGFKCTPSLHPCLYIYQSQQHMFQCIGQEHTRCGQSNCQAILKIFDGKYCRYRKKTLSLAVKHPGPHINCDIWITTFKEKYRAQ